MPVDWFPLWLSLKVALIATALSLVIGLWLAYPLAHRRLWGMEILDAATALPLVLPLTVLGYYLLVLFGRQAGFGRLYEWVTGSPLVFTWQAAVLAASTYAVRVVVRDDEGRKMAAENSVVEIPW